MPEVRVLRVNEEQVMFGSKRMINETARNFQGMQMLSLRILQSSH